MSKKPIPNKPIPKPASKNNVGKKLPKKISQTIDGKYYMALGMVLLITIISYFSMLHNLFVDLDDDAYFQNNPLIKPINLKEIFGGYFLGNYHPFTILFFGIEYQLFGLSPTGYHATSLLLHLFNVILVFYTIFLLCNKIEIALLVSFMFGIHPLHVESVAWASEQKDLLYAFFFLASYIFYLKYLKNQAKKFYVFSLMFFLLSLLSKAMAVTLPFLLVLTDYFILKDTEGKQGKWSLKRLLEKIPFFILSLAFGIVAVFAQHSSGALTDIAIFSFPQRIIFACYGFINYLSKLVLPINLCAFYPYPIKVVPIQYYLFDVSFIAIAFLIFYSFRYTKKIFFGIGFFAVTIFIVLQLLPVGSAIMADRYSYIPSIGIFYLIAEGFYWMWNKNYKIPVIAILSSITIFFSITTYTRCAVWENGITLYDDMINHNQTIADSYNSRGVLFKNENKYEEALKDFNMAISLKPDFAYALNNRGILFMDVKKPLEAERDFTKAISLNANYSTPHNNRGLIYMNKKMTKEAELDFNKAIELQPDYIDAYINRGGLFLNENRYEMAIDDFNKAIALNPNSGEAYCNNGIAKYFSGKKESACKDFQKSIDLGCQPAIDLYKQYCH
jgi:tetratricopeptide (TPR) repeat protein